MAAQLEKWVAGGFGLTYQNAFSNATLNGIVNGNAILSDVTFSNDLYGDMFADVSIQFANVVWALPAYIGVYIYPSNTYNNVWGDGRFAASAAGPPPSCYWVGDINFPTGNAVIYGSLIRLPVPPGQFRFVLYNQGGVQWQAVGSNICQVRFYNLQLV